MRWDLIDQFEVLKKGVYARALQNNAANTNAREIGLYAAPVADIAWGIVERASRSRV